jgi:hypothetical protein
MIRYLLLFTLVLSFQFQGFPQIINSKIKVEPSSTSIENDKHKCGTPDPGEHTRQYILDNIIANEQQLAAQRNNVTNCLPMKIHIIREDDGSGGLSLDDLAIAFANLNLVYYDADIEFFACGGINYINNSDWYNFNAQAPDNDDESTFCSPVEVTDAINVFFMNSITTSSGFNAAGYAYFPFNSVQSNRIFMINSVANNAPNSTFSHELGHYFSLYHTHQDTEFGSGDPNAERVVRTGANANCDVNGDLLCDTDADPRYASGEFDLGTCTYTGTDTDDLGVTYLPTTAINNIMSYFPDQCGGVFTSGQFTRMGAGLTIRMGHTAYNYSCSASVVSAPTGLTATLNGNQIDLAWTDNASNELGYIIERSSTSSTTGFLPIIYGGVGEDVSTFSDTDEINSNTTYWYRVRPVASACDTYSNVVNLTTGVIYCTPSYSIGCAQVSISDFSFDGEGTSDIANNTSGCSTNGYGDFSNLSAAVDAGNSYNLTASSLAGTCIGSYYPALVGIFVDWNFDGDFDDANEHVYSGADTLNPCFSTTIAVPTGAQTGNAVLRIVIDYNNTPTTACGSYGFGESEDYTLNVTGVGGLPIELTSFRGQSNNNAVRLSWTTESEINNDFFTLEKSKNGVDFEAIAIVNGAGISDRRNEYSHLDFTPYDGINYYRLMQTDFDGKFTLSDIIQISVVPREVISVNIFPNPVGKDEFSLSYNSITKGNLQYRITDLTGKVIEFQETEVEKGKNDFFIDTSQLSRGVYFLQTNQNDITQTIRFVRL